MRLLYVSPGAEVAERIVGDLDACEYMRREIGCEELGRYQISPEILMWHDKAATERILPVNGPALRIADEYGAELLSYFRDGVIRGAVFYTGPKTDDYFIGLSEAHCDRFMRLVLGTT